MFLLLVLRWKWRQQKQQLNHLQLQLGSWIQFADLVQKLRLQYTLLQVEQLTVMTFFNRIFFCAPTQPARVLQHLKFTSTISTYFNVLRKSIWKRLICTWPNIAIINNASGTVISNCCHPIQS